jgi:hypothetical protein
MIKTTFIEFLMPENIGIDTKMMNLQFLVVVVGFYCGPRAQR